MKTRRRRVGWRGSRDTVLLGSYCFEEVDKVAVRRYRAADIARSWDGMSNDLKELQRAIAVLRKFSKIDPKMQVATALTLCEVGAAGLAGRDVSPSDLEPLVGLPSGTMTRNVAYWADGYRDVTGAHGMVISRDHPQDGRRKLLSLNAKGQAFLKTIASAAAGGK